MFKEHQGDAAIQNTQPKTLVVDSKPSNTGVESNEKKQAPVQPTEHVPGESTGLKAQPSNTQEQQEVPETPVLGQMDDTESLSTQDDIVLQSGSLNPIAGMENTQNLQSAVLSSQQLASRNIIEIFNKHGREGFTPLTLKLMVQEFLNDGISEIQLPTSNGCITFNLNVINEESPEGLQNMLRAYINSSKIGKAIDAATNSSTPVDTKNHVFQDSATLEGSIDIDDDNDYGLSEPFSEEDSSNRQEDPLPIPTPGPTPATPILPKKPGQADAKSNCCQSNNGSITVTQSIQKSTVATWTFAVAGILAGAAAPAAYFAFSVSLLTTGIIAGVGVCCLVAAVIIYCCNRPSNSLECNNVGPVADRKLVG
ncbi:hypothetical protein EUZ93_03915 [Wolbachia pipientis]|nr:hypothetical protein [Wolbachia pipientis]